MSSAVLPLSLFFKNRSLEQASFFGDEAFLLLGSSLHSWLRSYLQSLGVGEKPLIHKDSQVDEGAFLRGPVFVASGAVVEATAWIQGPAYIGSHTEVRHGAYLRGNVYAGEKCILGHTTEVKNSVFLDGAKAGHFAYVGDSLLGPGVNLGAGTKLANLAFHGKEIFFFHPQSRERMPSGLRKFGAILGENAQTGCNSVLSPGTILLPDTAVMPCFHYQGTLLRGVAGSDKRTVESVSAVSSRVFDARA